MFELLQINGTPRRSGINAQTRQGRAIENEQASAPCAEAVHAFETLLKSRLTWKLRKRCCGVYNCAGHVLLNRRSSIYSEIEYRKIFEDDGYIKISTIDEADVGHVAVYTYKNKIVHLGIVFSIEKIHPDQNGRIVKVLSKIGDTGGEVFHIHNDYPLFDEVFFWKDVG